MLIYLQMIENDADKNKFLELYHKYKGLMFYITKSYLSNYQDREDALQMAFEAIARNISKISDVESPRTYSYIVNTIESKSIDVLRRIQKHPKENYEDAIAGITISLPGDYGLADAFAKLPARYREILLLRFECGYTTKDIAQMYGTTQGNIQKLIKRAKRVLGELLYEGDADFEKANQ